MNNISKLVENTMVRVKTEKFLATIDRHSDTPIAIRKFLMLELDTSGERKQALDLIIEKGYGQV